MWSDKDKSRWASLSKLEVVGTGHEFHLHRDDLLAFFELYSNLLFILWQSRIRRIRLTFWKHKRACKPLEVLSPLFCLIYIFISFMGHRSERVWLCQNIPEICPHIRSQSVCIHRVMHRIVSSERPAIEWLPPGAHTFSPYADSAPKIPIPLHSRHSQSMQVHLPDLLPASELRKKNHAHTSETNPQAAIERVWHPLDACRQYSELSRIVGKEDLTVDIKL